MVEPGLERSHFVGQFQLAGYRDGVMEGFLSVAVASCSGGGRARVVHLVVGFLAEVLRSPQAFAHRVCPPHKVVFAIAKLEIAALQRQNNSAKHVVAANQACGFALAGEYPVVPGDALVSLGVDSTVDRTHGIGLTGVLILAIGPEGISNVEARMVQKPGASCSSPGPGQRSLLALLKPQRAQLSGPPFGMPPLRRAYVNARPR